MSDYRDMLTQARAGRKGPTETPYGAIWLTLALAAVAFIFSIGEGH